jgi:hypothetical protein
MAGLRIELNLEAQPSFADLRRFLDITETVPANAPLELMHAEEEPYGITGIYTYVPTDTERRASPTSDKTSVKIDP